MSHAIEGDPESDPRAQELYENMPSQTSEIENQSSHLNMNGLNTQPDDLNESMRNLMMSNTFTAHSQPKNSEMNNEGGFWNPMVANDPEYYTQAKEGNKNDRNMQYPQNGSISKFMPGGNASIDEVRAAASEIRMRTNEMVQQLASSDASAVSKQSLEGGRTEETDEDLFAMYVFKVVHCSKQFVHDWKECPYAHEGETARRRHPSQHTAQPCPDFKSTKSCPRSDRCQMAHGPWEAGLHPDAFRTNLCAYGRNCQRRMCFFAHDIEELRSPQPGSMQQLAMKLGPLASPGGMWHPQNQNSPMGMMPGSKKVPAQGRGTPNVHGSPSRRNNILSSPPSGSQSQMPVPLPDESPPFSLSGQNNRNVGTGRGRMNETRTANQFQPQQQTWSGNNMNPMTSPQQHFMPSPMGIPAQPLKPQGSGIVNEQNPNSSTRSAGRNTGQYRMQNERTPQNGGRTFVGQSPSQNAGQAPSSRRQMIGLAGYNASRINNANANQGASALHVHIPIPNGSAIENPMASSNPRAQASTPEWVKQEDTSWVDKLLDSPL